MKRQSRRFPNRHINSINRRTLIWRNGLSANGILHLLCFAVRVAARFRDDPVGNLRHVLAINPPLDPKKATVNIDRIGLVKSYFIRKWKQSLKRKQELFPDR